MNPKEYLRLKEELIGKGFEREIKWCQELGPCPNPFRFFIEYAWVVLNSGMKNRVAEKTFKKIIDSINENGNPNKIGEVFRHRKKVLGIKEAWGHKNEWFLKFHDLCRDLKDLQEMDEQPEEADLEDTLNFLGGLPNIGPITRYHLARNLGLDVCKPDRHLVRIAKTYETTPALLCARLAKATGDRVGTIVMWFFGDRPIWG